VRVLNDVAAFGSEVLGGSLVWFSQVGGNRVVAVTFGAARLGGGPVWRLEARLFRLTKKGLLRKMIIPRYS
jgi:hypothetical protein